MPSNEEGLSYPFIRLERAIERARAMYSSDPASAAPMSPDVLRGVWGFGPNSSNLSQTINSLKEYGLLETGRASASGSVLSVAAIAFMDADDESRPAMLRDFALRPAMLRDLWKRWGGRGVQEPEALRHLRNDKGLKEEAAKSVFRMHLANAEFVGLTPDLSLPDDVAANGHAGPDCDGAVSVTVSGARLRISADVDLRGLDRLIETLPKYREILSIIGR